MAIIPAAVVLTLAVLVPSSAGIPACLQIPSLCFAQYTAIMATVQQETYSLDIVSSITTPSIETFQNHSTTPDQLLTNTYQQRVDQLLSIALEDQNDTSTLMGDDLATGNASTENTTEESRSRLSSAKDLWLETSDTTMVPNHVTVDFSRALNLASLRILRLGLKNFTIVTPSTVPEVVAGDNNDTHTERFVYAPKGSRLVISCSGGKNTQMPLSQYNWTRGIRGYRSVEFSQRITQGDQRELIIEEITKADAGIYFCLATANDTLLQNLIRLHVFSPADLAIGIPFVFRGSHCSKKETWLMLNQINAVLERRFGLYRFILSKACSTVPWYDQKKNEKYPSVLRVLALKRTKMHYKAPKCDTKCVMKSKLKDILSDIADIAYTVVEVGLRVGVDDDCQTEDCGATYVFQPNETVSELRVVYVCDAGQILYGTSACEPCFPGTYMPRSGLNEVCAPCPVHYYQREAGAINCIPCYNRSLASSNVTGADDTYVCALKQIIDNFTKDVKDVLSAVIILLFISVFGVLVTSTIAYFMWCRSRGKYYSYSQETLLELESTDSDETEPLRPSRKLTATTDMSIRSDVNRTAKKRSSGMKVDKAAHPSPVLRSRSLPIISNRNTKSSPKAGTEESGPSRRVNELGRKAFGSSRQGTTAPSRMTGSASRHSSRLRNNQPSEQVYQAIHSSNELPAAVHKPPATSDTSRADSVSQKLSGDVKSSKEPTAVSDQPLTKPSILAKKGDNISEPFPHKTIPDSLNARDLGSTTVSKPIVDPILAATSPPAKFQQPTLSEKPGTMSNLIPDNNSTLFEATAETTTEPTMTPNSESPERLHLIPVSSSTALVQPTAGQAPSQHQHAPPIPPSNIKPSLVQASPKPPKGPPLPATTPYPLQPPSKPAATKHSATSAYKEVLSSSVQPPLKSPLTQHKTPASSASLLSYFSGSSSVVPAAPEPSTGVFVARDLQSSTQSSVQAVQPSQIVPPMPLTQTQALTSPPLTEQQSVHIPPHLKSPPPVATPQQRGQLLKIMSPPPEDPSHTHIHQLLTQTQLKAHTSSLTRVHPFPAQPRVTQGQLETHTETNLPRAQPSQTQQLFTQTQTRTQTELPLSRLQPSQTQSPLAHTQPPTTSALYLSEVQSSQTQQPFSRTEIQTPTTLSASRLQPSRTRQLFTEAQPQTSTALPSPTILPSQTQRAFTQAQPQTPTTLSLSRTQPSRTRQHFAEAQPQTSTALPSPTMLPSKTEQPYTQTQLQTPTAVSLSRVHQSLTQQSVTHDQRQTPTTLFSARVQPSLTQQSVTHDQRQTPTTLSSARVQPSLTREPVTFDQRSTKQSYVQLKPQTPTAVSLSRVQPSQTQRPLTHPQSHTPTALPLARVQPSKPEQPFTTFPLAQAQPSPFRARMQPSQTQPLLIQAGANTPASPPLTRVQSFHILPHLKSPQGKPPVAPHLKRGQSLHILSPSKQTPFQTQTLPPLLRMQPSHTRDIITQAQPQSPNRKLLSRAQPSQTQHPLTHAQSQTPTGKSISGVQPSQTQHPLTHAQSQTPTGKSISGVQPSQTQHPLTHAQSQTPIGKSISGVQPSPTQQTFTRDQSQAPTALSLQMKFPPQNQQHFTSA